MKSQNEEEIDFGFSSDESCVLKYLNNFPSEFLTEMEISRRADGRQRFEADSHWAHYGLSQLLDMRLIETDGEGRYRLTTNRAGIGGPARKFMAPHIKEILQRSGQNFDLSNYA